MNLDELKSVFQKVYSVLHNEGIFAFDMNMEKGFLKTGLLHFIFQRKNMFVRLILHIIMKIKSRNELYTISP